MSAKNPGTFGSKSLEDAVDRIWKAAIDANNYIEHEQGKSAAAIAAEKRDTEETTVARKKRISLAEGLGVGGILSLFTAFGMLVGAIVSGSPLGVDKAMLLALFTVAIAFALAAISDLIKWAAGKEGSR